VASLVCERAQLCLPQGADQFLNAAAVASSGAGLSLMPDESSTEAIRTSVTRLLEDRSYREAAKRISTTIASMPSCADVAAILERLS
jgi:UDP:flavonoid glycosyltransferase YjiC (YdhE family)